MNKLPRFHRRAESSEPWRTQRSETGLGIAQDQELEMPSAEKAMNSLLAEARENIWIPSWSVPTLQRFSTDRAFERLELQVLRTNAESGPWER